MKAIDVDALLAVVSRCGKIDGVGLEPLMAVKDIKALISAMPTVDAITLLKAQEPRLLTRQDFEDNPMLDYLGALPAYIEYRYPGAYVGDGYWGSWRLEEFDAYDGLRPWTYRPKDRQRESTPWE